MNPTLRNRLALAAIVLVILVNLTGLYLNVRAITKTK